MKFHQKLYKIEWITYNKRQHNKFVYHQNEQNLKNVTQTKTCIPSKMNKSFTETFHIFGFSHLHFLIFFENIIVFLFYLSILMLICVYVPVHKILLKQHKIIWWIWWNIFTKKRNEIFRINTSDEILWLQLP